MAHLTDIAPMNEWDRMLSENRVNAKTINGVTSWKYTFSATKVGKWNKVETSARGLLTDSEGNIIGRPYKKFFEWEEVAHKPSLRKGFHGPVEVMDKLDGSLVIGYNDPSTGEYVLATSGTPAGAPDVKRRDGSLWPNMSKHFNNLYKEKYQDKWTPEAGYTYIWEAITPLSKIVVNYGDQDKLVLTGKVNIETGVSQPLSSISEWPFEKAEIFSYNSLEEALEANNRKGMEGYVVHFTETDARVKLKQADYRTIHKLSAVNPTKGSVAKLMANGVEKDHIMAIMKDPVRRESFSRLYDEVSAEINEVVDSLKLMMLLLADLGLTPVEVRDEWEPGDAPEYTRGESRAVAMIASQNRVQPSNAFSILKGYNTLEEIAWSTYLKKLKKS